MKTIKFLSLIVIILLLQACVQRTQIDNVAIINVRGIDLLEENGEYKIETIIIPYVFDPNASVASAFLVGKGNTIKDALVSAANRFSYFLTNGKINLELYGKEAAEKGLLPLINTIVRDARVPEKMLMAVTNETAREIFEKGMQQNMINKERYTQDLISKEVKLGMMSPSTLQYFTRYVEQVGIDPILPLIGEIEEQQAIIGAALFQRDRYVGQITLKEAYLINQLREHTRDTPLFPAIPLENYQEELPYQGGESVNEDSIYVFMNLIKGKGKVKITDINQLAFKATIKLEGELLETSLPLNISGKNTASKIEEDIANFYEEEYKKLLAKLKDVKSDPFGLGQLYTSTRIGNKTTHEEWLEKYPDVTMEVEVDVTITNFGLID